MSFFSKEPHMTLAFFDGTHILVIVFCAALIFLTILFAKRIREQEKWKKWLPIVFCLIVWILEVAFHIWNYVNQTRFVEKIVPLDLCTITLYMTVVLCFWKNQSFFEIYYFLSIGALMALLFPSYGWYGPDHFRFYHFFLNHLLIVWFNFYLLSVYQLKIRFKGFVRLLIALIPFSLIIRFIDVRFNVNYMFLLGKTVNESPLDFLGDGVWYFINLMLLAVIVFTLMYLIAPKEKKNKALESADYSDTE